VRTDEINLKVSYMGIVRRRKKEEKHIGAKDFYFFSYHFHLTFIQSHFIFLSTTAALMGTKFLVG